MEKIDIAIIGAGVVGLAVGSQLAKKGRSIFVLERHNSFGQETSSRNSEVIHAGIYYKPGSFKANACVEGKRLLYKICQENKIPHRRCGKLIVANTKKEEEIIHALFENAKQNSVEDLEILSKDKIKNIEPEVKADLALCSRSTGIIDSHKLMEYFIEDMNSRDAGVVYNSDVVAINKANSGYILTIESQQEGKSNIEVSVVVNSAGLESDTIASKLGIDIKKQRYDLKYNKGQYFRVGSSKARLLSRLVYPPPMPKAASLGIHATVDLAGGVRLGPDDRYIERGEVNYDVDTKDKDKFFQSAKTFLPFLSKDDLIPDTAGIRPKLQAEGESERDFIIKEESELGFPGFINLIGIESPGLTAALSIARYVETLVKNIL